ncbi:hypothetical protein [Salinispora oceanensis]|uniref:hypothetical protein n=1 Tax=Salinispora oceanensis TaxID=1050199 RepID=UPI0003699BCE|nr:hypothetical protein [Salinispora oceanensis]
MRAVASAVGVGVGAHSVATPRQGYANDGGPCGDLPIALQLVADGVAEPDHGRVVGCVDLLQDVRQPATNVHGRHVAANDIWWCPADGGQFFLERRGELRGSGGEEVRDGAMRPDQGHQQIGAGRIESAEHRPAPGKVQRVQAGLAQYPQAEHGFVDRRYREAGVREVLNAEREDDH